METLGCAGVELHTRQKVKRKRYDETGDCVPAKRPLTEETMAAFMRQLNLSTALSTSPSLLPQPSPLTPPPLSITTVTTCPAMTVEATSDPNDVLMRGGTPLHNSRSSRNRPRAGSTTCPHRALTPPRSAGLHKGSGTRRVVASPIMEGLDLASSSERLSQHSVHIRVTPATPPFSESSGSPCQEDCEPMEQTSLSPTPSHIRQGKHWRVVLEDISSDSSDGPDGSEMSHQVWLAPELQSLTTGQRSFLSPPILGGIPKNGMAVVPWVERERYLTSIVTRAQVSSTESEDSGSDSEFQTDEKSWDYSMHSD